MDLKKYSQPELEMFLKFTEALAKGNDGQLNTADFSADSEPVEMAENQAKEYAKRRKANRFRSAPFSSDNEILDSVRDYLRRKYGKK